MVLFRTLENKVCPSLQVYGLWLQQRKVIIYTTLQPWMTIGHYCASPLAMRIVIIIAVSWIEKGISQSSCHLLLIVLPPLSYSLSLRGGAMSVFFMTEHLTDHQLVSGPGAATHFSIFNIILCKDKKKWVIGLGIEITLMYGSTYVFRRQIETVSI